MADEAERELNRESEESKALFETAKKRFGTTLDIREAGYVLPDGSMLDFSVGFILPSVCLMAHTLWLAQR